MVDTASGTLIRGIDEPQTSHTLICCISIQLECLVAILPTLSRAQIPTCPALMDSTVPLSSAAVTIGGLHGL